MAQESRPTPQSAIRNPQSNMGQLLHYRPWRGQFHGTGMSIWPIARIALWMILRRKLFWALYALGLLIFFMFFFGQYLLAWAESQAAGESVRIGMLEAEPARFTHLL